jgi:hypothetical protein
MTKTTWTALAIPAFLVLAACSKPAPPEGSAPPGAPSSNSAADHAASVPQLAYDDNYGFTAPAAGADALLKADRAACDSAGVSQCQMVSLTANSDAAAGFIEKTLELRVAPGWLKTWQDGLEARLAPQHARIRQQSVSSEDLSLQVVDTEAHLKNKEALRDRLRDIVRTHDGKLGDIIDAENQLSQVQTDIDATRSALAVMRKRIETVHLILGYRSDVAPAASDILAPVTGALKSSVGIAMQVVAMLITLAAALVPVAVAITLVVWPLRRWRKKRPVPASPDLTA